MTPDAHPKTRTERTMTMERPVSVEITAPFASNPDEPTLCYQVPTTPGFSTGATISLSTARDLIGALQEKLDKAAR